MTVYGLEFKFIILSYIWWVIQFIDIQPPSLKVDSDLNRCRTYLTGPPWRWRSGQRAPPQVQPHSAQHTLSARTPPNQSNSRNLKKNTKRLSSLSHEDRSGYCRDSSQKLISNKENNKNALNCTTYTRSIKWTATIKTL